MPVPDVATTRHLRQELSAHRESFCLTTRSCAVTSEQETADLTFLNGMHHAADAGHRSGNRQGCLKGTRKDILWQIERWLMDEPDQRVFWLNGLAGTGKSTISQTFAEMCFADGRLGASFFCSRDFEDRSNLHIIFPTLAFQLAYQYPSFRKGLLQVLRTNPDVSRESLCSQMEKIIVGPLKTTGIPTLIIIDALDECRDEEPASAILSILSRYVDQIPDVKFFITGRPEPRIRSGFRLEALRPITEVFKLHDVERSSVDMDIKRFLRTRLADAAKNRSHSDLAEEWPSSPDIDILCEKAAGLFVYASTAVKFVASQHHQPSRRMALLVSLPQNTGHEGRSGIDTLYTEVLIQAFRDMDLDNMNSDSQEVYHCSRSVVGAILLVFNPLSIKDLSELLSDFDTPSGISTALRSFHSLLLVPDNTEDPIHSFHKSFPDFLMDPERCKDRQFFVEPSVHHAELVLSCLNLMKKRLKRNICNLDDYAVLDRVEDLSTRRMMYIGGALEYACHFWTRHLVKIPTSGHDAQEVCKGIDGFFTTYLLFWIEVLVVMGNLDIGVHAMNDIQQWYNLVSCGEFICQGLCSYCIQSGLICKWTNDSQHFILEHFNAIHNSPSQIYHSALPLSPSRSWLHEHYSSVLLGEVKVIKGLQAEWGACSHMASFDYTPLALTCLKDIIAASLQYTGNIIVLNATTGICTSILSSHTANVNCIAFSLDGTLLVSGSHDKTVKLWDMQTGGVIKTSYNHTSSVLSVSISPDSATIASGTVGATIHLWDTWRGECYCVINGHEGVINSVGFSPTNSQLLISASDDNTVQQWDISGHKFGPTYKGTHTSFSSGGTHFVLWEQGGMDATVQNSDSGMVVAEIQSFGNGFLYCCLSPDGKFMAGGTGHTIYIWNVTSSGSCLVETFIGHLDKIASLVFSSSSSLVSSSCDDSIKFWQFCTSSKNPVTISSEPIPPTPASIQSVSLEVTNGIAISSDSAGVVKTWDILTGLCKASFQTPAKPDTWRDAQLIEGRLTFIWLEAQKIYIWDIEKEELLQTLNAQAHCHLIDLRISGDRSKVFLLDEKFIQAWSIQTGQLVGEVRLEGRPADDPIIVDGSKVWVYFKNSQAQGWDFGFPGSTPVPFSNTPLNKPHLDFVGIKRQNTSQSRIEDKTTGIKVFQLSGRYAKPVKQNGMAST